MIDVFQPDIPSDSAPIERFFYAGHVTGLRIAIEAFTEVRASANLDFFSRVISGFITDFPLRYMELEWQFVDYLSRTRFAIQGILTRAGFGSVGTAYIQLKDAERKRRVVVYRRESDVRPVTIVRNRVIYQNGHRGLRLRLFSSELVVDDQQNLCMNDELRQAVLSFQ